MRRINLTFPGLGGPSMPPPPQAPAAPPPPPRQVDASREVARRGGAQGRKQAENIRNEGGGRGINVLQSTTRALKTLTGQ